jgi:hypothetical protein
MKWIAAASLTAVIVVGCSPEQVGAPRLLPITTDFALVGQAAFVTTGGAEVTFRKSDVTNRLSFVANRDVDGVVADGQFEYTGLIASGETKPPEECKHPPCAPPPPTTTIDTEGQIHGIVQCFTLGKGGNSARVEGIITQASNTKLEGLPVFWDVTDNGEGTNANPDLSSILFFGKSGCLTPPALDLLKVESGNVQVHGD